MRKIMKKISYVFILIVAFICLQPMAKAANYNLAVKEATGKGTSEVKIPLYLEVEVDELVRDGKIGCETNHADFSCTVEFLTSSGATGQEDTNGFVYQVIDPDETVGFPTGLTKIAEITVSNSSAASNSNLKVSLTNSYINLKNPDSRITEFEDKYISVGAKKAEKVKSDDARLKSIKFSQGTMYPEFSPDVTDYTIYNIADTINSISITPVCNDGECDVTPHGGKSVSGHKITLNQGENLVTVEVYSENGENSLNYNFKIYRGETSFNSPKLKELSFGEYILTPAFSSDTLDYTLVVPNEVNSLTKVIKYASEDDKATVKVSGIDNFAIGENLLTIIVDNATGDETYTYKVKITRSEITGITVIRYYNDQVIFKDHANNEEIALPINEFKTKYNEYYLNIINGVYKFDDKGYLLTEEDKKDEPNKTQTDKTEEKKEKKDNKIVLVIILIAVGIIIIVGSGLLIFRKKKPENEDENLESVSSNTEEIDETGIEESAVGTRFSSSDTENMDVDEALSDLMSTKQYEIKDED